MEGGDCTRACRYRSQIPVEMLKLWFTVMAEVRARDGRTPNHKDDSEMVKLRRDIPDSRAVIHASVEAGNQVNSATLTVAFIGFSLTWMKRGNRQ